LRDLCGYYGYCDEKNEEKNEEKDEKKMKKR
jgi:hypothetical protein